jgi:hypothetical protein
MKPSLNSFGDNNLLVVNSFKLLQKYIGAIELK